MKFCFQTSSIISFGSTINRCINKEYFRIFLKLLENGSIQYTLTIREVIGSATFTIRTLLRENGSWNWACSLRRFGRETDLSCFEVSSG